MGEDLRKRFGRLVAAYRRQRRLTQEQLAFAANISVNTVSKIEGGATGARFPVVSKIAHALDVDPGALFALDAEARPVLPASLDAVVEKLADLSDEEIAWVRGIIDAALNSPGRQ